MSAPSKAFEVDKYSPEKISSNNYVVYFSRICVSSLAGCAIGILGITGIYGLLCYFLSYALLTVLLLMKMQFNTEIYFQSTSQLIWDGLFQGLLSYVLFWTLLYDIVHVY